MNQIQWDHFPKGRWTHIGSANGVEVGMIKEYKKLGNARNASSSKTNKRVALKMSETVAGLDHFSQHGNVELAQKEAEKLLRRHQKANV